jgi:hypothetical protein
MLVSGADSSALLLLRRTGALNFAPNALPPTTGPGSTTASTAVDKIADILANAPGASLQDEVKLIKRVGQVLGVDMDKYASATDYANALRQAVAALKAAAMAHNQSWKQVEKDLEHEMGLDKLGISLDTVINAIAGDSGSQDALKQALEKQALNSDYASSEASTNDGTYGRAGASQ